MTTQEAGDSLQFYPTPKLTLKPKSTRFWGRADKSFCARSPHFKDTWSQLLSTQLQKLI